jgi:hypothetical protein
MNDLVALAAIAVSAMALLSLVWLCDAVRAR